MITVVAALIRMDNKILIAKRSTGDRHVIGKWEFPGGKVELNETEEDAIEREIKEEFEIDVKVIKFLKNNICSYPNKIIDLRLYECEYLSGNIKLHDHLEYKFISIDEFINYDFAPADIPFIEYLREGE